MIVHPGDWGYGHNIRKIKQRIFDKCCWSSLDFTTLLTKSRLTSSAQDRKWFRAYSEKDLIKMLHHFLQKVLHHD